MKEKCDKNNWTSWKLEVHSIHISVFDQSDSTTVRPIMRHYVLTITSNHLFVRLKVLASWANQTQNRVYEKCRMQKCLIV